MTVAEISIMGSISCASTFVMMPFYGYLLGVFGRKRSIIILYLPQLLAWILLVTLKRVEALICAMFLCGIGGTLFSIFPIYINEFCEPSIRGALSSSGIIFHGVGTLLSYWIGGTVQYTTMTYIGLSLVIIGMILILFLKESPLYLMIKGLEKEAAKSIAYYKGLNLDSIEIISHLETLRQLITSDIKLNDIPEMESLNSDIKSPQKNLSILKFLSRYLNNNDNE
nr:facilitated trehalose transporter Tret1-like [Danaus plexippus plexippus]